MRSITIAALGIFVATAAATAADPPVKPITAEERAHWSFQTPVRPPLPAVKNGAWMRNPIDAFILDAMENAVAGPADEADRPTLLRRLTFDLTGLPPTPEQIDMFLSDPAPGAYERLVDRLLASPRHGERWAQHWLDLARYADTDGFEFDQARPDAWRYRDWVVDALNADMPYDRFIRLQLAGDEAEPGHAGASVATGFNRCYPDMVDLNDQGLRRQNALNDITETTGLVFLGLTIGCARCHDHKFDPIRQADFYRLQAFFTPARFRDDLPVASASDRAAYDAARAAWSPLRQRAAADLVGLEGPYRALLSPGLPKNLSDETAAAFARRPDDRSPRDVELVLTAWQADRRMNPKVWPVVLDPTTARVRQGLLVTLDRLKATEPPALPQARGIDERGPNAPPTYLLLRGDYASKGPTVGPEVPAVLRKATNPSTPVRLRERSTGRRSALADWLTRPDHPLTARVIVNRLWQHHFGQGLVTTPSDFGTLGAPPTHPELLDWLATELVEKGWSLRSIHRLMVTSATYRQSSKPSPRSAQVDPANELFTRHRRTRLDGEAIRDALLAASGSLSPTMGGPAVYPDLPAELTRLSNKGAVWPVSKTREERSRRSLYVFVRRNLRYPFFEAFDRPDTNASCPARPSSTIAPQALTLLNSRVAADAAAAIAERISREAGADRASAVRRTFRLTLGREPDAGELADALAFLGRDAPLARLALALVNANEFVYVE